MLDYSEMQSLKTTVILLTSQIHGSGNWSGFDWAVLLHLALEKRNILVVFTCNKTSVKCARRFLLYTRFTGWAVCKVCSASLSSLSKAPQGFSNCYLQEDSQLPNIKKTQKMAIFIKAKPVIDIVSFSWYLYNESKRTVDFEGKGHKFQFSMGRKIMNMLFYYATNITTQITLLLFSSLSSLCISF